MYEKVKLEEARYFYSSMQAEVNNPNTFQYNLSAFLSAARTVLQYALEEAKRNNGQRWYDDLIANSNTLSFFKDKRNINIHAEPIKPRKDYAVTLKATITISTSLSIKLMNESGDIMEQRDIKKDKPPRELPKDDTTIEVKYRFADWKGNEDVMELSKTYLDELEQVIEDGIKRGFIRG